MKPKLTLTRPKDPEFETAQRVRSVRVKSTAEIEEEMMAKIPKFKARPLNKKVKCLMFRYSQLSPFDIVNMLLVAVSFFLITFSLFHLTDSRSSNFTFNTKKYTTATRISGKLKLRNENVEERETPLMVGLIFLVAAGIPFGNNGKGQSECRSSFCSFNRIFPSGLV